MARKSGKGISFEFARLGHSVGIIFLPDARVSFVRGSLSMVGVRIFERSEQNPKQAPPLINEVTNDSVRRAKK